MKGASMKNDLKGPLIIGGLIAMCTFAAASQRTVVCEMVYHDD